MGVRCRMEKEVLKVQICREGLGWGEGQEVCMWEVMEQNGGGVSCDVVCNDWGNGYKCDICGDYVSINSIMAVCGDWTHFHE